LSSFEIIAEEGQTWLRVTLDAQQHSDLRNNLRRQLLYILRAAAKRELRQMRQKGAVLGKEAILFLRAPSW